MGLWSAYIYVPQVEKFGAPHLGSGGDFEVGFMERLRSWSGYLQWYVREVCQR